MAEKVIIRQLKRKFKERMRYYYLHNSIDTDVIGPEYPQIQTFGCTMHKDDPDSVYNVRLDRIPELTPNLNCLILHPKARLTDIISTAFISQGFIISRKVKEIFEKFNLPEHRFYPAVVRKGGHVYDNYFWFYFIGDLGNRIDYEKTEFYLMDSFGKSELVNIDSKESLINLTKSISSLIKVRSNRIYFIKEVHEDLFETYFGDIRVIISKELLDALRENNITGFQADEVDHLG